jgi:hypothetical protein
MNPIDPKIIEQYCQIARKHNLGMIEAGPIRLVFNDPLESGDIGTTPQGAEFPEGDPDLFYSAGGS